MAGPQNIYDDTAFFAGYSALRREDTGLNAALEVPALRRLLPPSLEGLRVLDLGCGFGHFARFARSQGAREVVAVDVSARMLTAAREATDDPAIRYVHAPVEAFEPDPAGFDLVVSSLVLHYVEGYGAIVRRVFRALRPGGRFVLSVEHPVCTALGTFEWVPSADHPDARWTLGRYRDEGLRHTKWFVDDVIKYHRTVETYVNTLLDAGFALRRLEEPEPTPEALAQRPELELHRRRPPFLMLAADKP